MSPDVLSSISVHPTEELLEEYSFNRVSEPALGILEEHLLGCTGCQDKLLAIDEYTAEMKAGIAAFAREQPTVGPAYFAFSKGFGFSAAWSAALLLAFVGGLLAWRLLPQGAVAPVAAVRLMALRGGGGDGLAWAPAGHRLDLEIDKGDLADAAGYRVEVVSSSGREWWSGTAQLADQTISAQLSAALPPGTYWVRLYSSGDQLRREFGMRVE